MWTSYMMCLVCLLLLCHGGGAQRECDELLRSCPRINCLKDISALVRCTGCVLLNMSEVCDRLKRSVTPCELYIGEEKYDCDSRDEDSQEEKTSNAPETISDDSSDSNNTTVIVIAVCVSIVVIIIAVLIAGVYCWRVRSVSREQKKAVDVEMRTGNSPAHNEVTGNNSEASRPNSTYCTINDIGNTNEYHVLEAQTSTEVTMVDKNQDNCTSLTIMKHGVDRTEATNDSEYNRIEFNQRRVAKLDPSYSHLAGVESDYGGDAESVTKIFAYQYGVPIKIRNTDRPENVDNDSTNNGEPETYDNIKDETENTDYGVNIERLHDKDSDKMAIDNGADDDYVIPKEDQQSSIKNSVAKPRAIVNPINLHDNVLNTKVIEEQCNKTTFGEVNDDTSRSAGVKIERTDDYEMAVVKNLGLREKVDDSKAIIKQPTVQIDQDTKRVTQDGYEIAVVNNEVLSEETDNGTANTEPQTVQINQNTEKITRDGYEIAVVKKEVLSEEIENGTANTEPQIVQIIQHREQITADGYEIAVVNRAETVDVSDND